MQHAKRESTWRLMEENYVVLSVQSHMRFYQLAVDLRSIESEDRPPVAITIQHFTTQGNL